MPALAVLAVQAATGGGCGRGRCDTGVVLGLVDGIAKSRPYLDSLRHELGLAAVAAFVTVAVTVLPSCCGDVVSSRVPAAPMGSERRCRARRRHGARGVRRAATPHAPDVRIDGSRRHDIVALQAQLGLPPSGPRTYAEQSMHWLVWWLGRPVSRSASSARRCCCVARCGPWRRGVAVRVRAARHGRHRPRRPSITPDHPWADRRFVPVVLPGSLSQAVGLSCQVTRWTRERSARATAIVVATSVRSPWCCSVARCVSVARQEHRAR